MRSYTLFLCAIPILAPCAVRIPKHSFRSRSPYRLQPERVFGNNYIYSSQYQSGNWTTGAQGVSNAAGDYDGFYRVIRTNPAGTRQAVIWKDGDVGGRRNVLVSIWDGTNWDDGNGSPYGDVKDLSASLAGTVDNDSRSMDAAYEQSSGELLVVSGYINVDTVRYWTLPNPSSFPDTGLITISVNSTSRTFTRSSGSYLTDGFKVGDTITTSGFTNAGNNTTKIIQSVTDLVITVTASAGLVTETGDGNERVLSNTWSDTKSGTIFCNSSAYRWVRLAPQPGTDKIGFVGMAQNLSSSENAAVALAIWDGSAWGNTLTPYSYGGNNGTDAIDIQAVRSGTYAGDFVAVWARGQYVYARIWRNNLSSWDGTVQLADLGTGKRAQWLKLKPNPNGDNLILAIGTTYVRADTWTTSLNVNGSLQFTRASGSFVTDGFVAGDLITMSGFANAGNNVTKTINTVDATTITVTDTTGLVAETGGGNERIKYIKTLNTGQDTIDVNATARTFTRSAGGYSYNGFMAGDQIITSGFTNAGNNTVKTIQTVTDTVITVTDGTGLVNETGNGNEQIQRTYSLYTMTYDGDTRTFSSLSSAHETALYGNPDYNRPFDVIWDPDAGSNNVLLVYSDLWGLRYRTSTDGGSSWGSEQTVTSSYQAYWVQMERVPGMMYMGIHDNADDLRTWTWASSTWTAKNTVSTDLETGYNTNREVEVFAIASNSSSTYKLEKHIAPLQGDFYMSTTNTTMPTWAQTLLDTRLSSPGIRQNTPVQPSTLKPCSNHGAPQAQPTPNSTT